MKKSVIYSRVSTDIQSNESQFRDLKDWASKNDYKVLKSFGEKVSGYDTSKERAEYDNMKEYVLLNKVNTILIWELSRLGRSTSHTLKEIEFFRDNQIDIFFKKENIHTISSDPTSKMLLTMLSSISEFERNTIIERSKRGMRSSILAGKRTGWPLMPYGLDSDKNSFVKIHPTESLIVKKIFEMAIQGSSIRGIATHLNSLGVPTRSTLMGRKRTLKTGDVISFIWKTNTIRKLLKNPVYKGERHYDNEVISLPSIIGVSDWNKVQERFHEKTGYRTRTKYQYLLKGKLRCGHCKIVYVSISRIHKVNNNLVSHYACNARLDAGIKCKAGQFKSSILDDNVYELLFRHKEVMISLRNESIKDFDPKQKEEQIDFYKSEIENGLARKKRIVTLFKDGHISDKEFKLEEATIRKSHNANESMINKIKVEIENFKDIDIKNLDMFKSLALEKDFNIRREFVLKYIDEVMIYKVDKTDIDFEKLWFWELGLDTPKPVKRTFKKPGGQDKIIYVEIFAFGLEKPLKAVMTNKGINYSTDNLKFENGVLKQN